MKQALMNKEIIWQFLEAAENKGHKEGEKKRSREIALAMLKEDLQIDQISKLTGLSADEIKSLQK